MALLPPRLLSPRQSPQPPIPSTLPEGPGKSLRRRPTPFLLLTGSSAPSRLLRSLSGPPAGNRLGRLCQASFWRPPPGPPISWPLYPSRRHLQRTLARLAGWLSHLPLERLSPLTTLQSDDRFRRGV